jgi:hypothetical protein
MAIRQALRGNAPSVALASVGATATHASAWPAVAYTVIQPSLGSDKRVHEHTDST